MECIANMQFVFIKLNLSDDFSLEKKSKGISKFNL